MGVDTLSQALEAYIAQRESKVREEYALGYGVWIPGAGWLRGSSSRPFGTAHRRLAEQTARLVGNGARVLLADKDMPDFQSAMLVAEREAQRARAHHWTARLARWVHGLFRPNRI